MKTYKIYALRLVNSDEIKYIGYTGTSLKKRLSRHLYECFRYNHKNANWIKKHKDNEGIDIILLEDNINEIEIAWLREVEYIRNYRELGYDLNNTTDGGEGVSGILISEKLKGEGNPFYGKKHTEDSRNRMSIKAKERTGESNSFYGKKHKIESKNKISNGRVGKCEGDKNPFYGRRHTIETKVKMSISSKDKKNKHSFKSVIQIDMDGRFLKVWSSISDAAESVLGDKKFGTYISAVCNGKKKQAGGYYWQYEKK